MIRCALLAGELTVAQICDRLNALVDEELEKSTDEVDLSYVESCQNLIWSLASDEAYVSTMETSKDAFFRTCDMRRRRQVWLKRIGMVMLSSIALVFLFILCGQLLNRIVLR